MGQDSETGIITEIILFAKPTGYSYAGCNCAHSISSEEMIEMYVKLSKKGMIFAGFAIVSGAVLISYSQGNPDQYWDYRNPGRSPLGYFPGVPFLVLENDKLFWFTTTERIKNEVQVQ